MRQPIGKIFLELSNPQTTFIIQAVTRPSSLLSGIHDLTSWDPMKIVYNGTLFIDTTQYGDKYTHYEIDGSMQERRNSSALVEVEVGVTSFLH